MLTDIRSVVVGSESTKGRAAAVVFVAKGANGMFNSSYGAAPAITGIAPLANLLGYAVIRSQ